MQQSEPETRHINALKSRHSRIYADDGKGENDETTVMMMAMIRMMTISIKADNTDSATVANTDSPSTWGHLPSCPSGLRSSSSLILVIGKSFSGIDMGNGYQYFRKKNT